MAGVESAERAGIEGEDRWPRMAACRPTVGAARFMACFARSAIGCRTWQDHVEGT